MRDVGKHFPVNVMLAKDSVQSRHRGRHLVHRVQLHAAAGVRLSGAAIEARRELQIGGSDQWGNITAGIDLIRRVEGKTAHALTCPLLTKCDGSKLGKTEAGAVWLDRRRTSPYKFYQYWINVDDATRAIACGFHAARTRKSKRWRS